jgi:hypothetical protein
MREVWKSPAPLKVLKEMSQCLHDLRQASHDWCCRSCRLLDESEGVLKFEREALIRSAQIVIHFRAY